MRLGQSLSANYQWRAQQRKELANDTDVARHRSFVTRTIAVVCERDTWSADAIACFASAKVETTAEPGQGDVNTCAKKLGFEQSNAFRAAFRPYGKSEHAAPCP